MGIPAWDDSGIRCWKKREAKPALAESTWQVDASDLGRFAGLQCAGSQGVDRSVSSVQDSDSIVQRNSGQARGHRHPRYCNHTSPICEAVVMLGGRNWGQYRPCCVAPSGSFELSKADKRGQWRTGTGMRGDRHLPFLAPVLGTADQVVLGQRNGSF